MPPTSRLNNYISTPKIHCWNFTLHKNGQIQCDTADRIDQISYDLQSFERTKNDKRMLFS